VQSLAHIWLASRQSACYFAAKIGAVNSTVSSPSNSVLFRWVPWIAVAALCAMLLVVSLQLRSLPARYRALIADLQGEMKQLRTQMKDLFAINEQQEREIEAFRQVNAKLTKENAEWIRLTEYLKQEIGNQNVKSAQSQERFAEQTALIELIEDPTINVATLADPSNKTRACARVYWHGATKKGVVVVANLAPVLKGNGASLELWTFCGKSPAAPTKLFWTDPAGQGAYPIEVPGHLTCVDKFTVTLEATDDELLPVPKGAVVLASK